MNILGIESSCDETAAAVVSGGRSGPPRVRSSVVASQVAMHRPYGGVVPEIASREHIRFVTSVVERALRGAKIPLKRVDAVAATAGPGLPGSLLVGLTAGKALAWLAEKPFIAVNHIEAHIWAAFLDRPSLRPPLLALVASGGHTELVLMRRLASFEVIGRTRDDAAGEAYDKVAKLLGLGYPGGPAIERAARTARREVRLPVARMKDGSMDFSFSGLKTAVANARGPEGGPGKLAAGFQRAVIGALVAGAERALGQTGARTLVLAGGVAANAALRGAMAELARKRGAVLVAPPIDLCTDNAAMIACAGWFMAREGTRMPLSTPAAPGWNTGARPAAEGAAA